MAENKEALLELVRRYPNHYIHKCTVFGIPVWMFYTIYPGDDPSAPYPHIEDCLIFTEEGIRADEWVPEEEVKHMEDNIFAAHGKRGR